MQNAEPQKQLKDLNPNPKNPRKVTDKKLEMLKKALKEFGDLGGIILNRTTNQLLGGHQRSKVLPPNAPIVILKAYDKPTRTGTVAEGYVEVDGERFNYREVIWDEAREKAANIAANKGAGEWDRGILSDMLLDLDAMNIDMDLTMFSDEEIEAMIVPVEILEPMEAPDESLPDLKKEAITKPGDIWILGNHRLMCGDSTNIQHVDSLIDGDTIDMVYTDPPYGINCPTDTVSRNSGFESKSMAKGNSFSKIVGDDTIDTAVAAFGICDSLSSTICYWGGNYYAHQMPPSPTWIVWDKRVEENMRDMNSDCELAYVKHPSKKSVRIYRHVWKGMIKDSEHGQGRVHPTQKPIALAEWCINELNGGARTVLDLFAGSGSTLIACERLKKTCYAMEIDPIYCDVIIERWCKHTGKTATLVQPT